MLRPRFDHWGFVQYYKQRRRMCGLNQDRDQVVANSNAMLIQCAMVPLQQICRISYVAPSLKHRHCNYCCWLHQICQEFTWKARPNLRRITNQTTSNSFIWNNAQKKMSWNKNIAKPTIIVGAYNAFVSPVTYVLKAPYSRWMCVCGFLWCSGVWCGRIISNW